MPTDTGAAPEWPLRDEAPGDFAGSGASGGTLWLHLRLALPGVIGLSLASTLAWYRGNTTLPPFLLGAACVLVGVCLAVPSAGHRIQQAVEWLGHWVGRVLSIVLMAAVWALLVLPVALLNRAVRIDVLSGEASSAAGWQDRPGEAIPNRGYAREPHPHGDLGRRAVRLLAVAALIGLAAIPVVDRLETTDAPALTPFGPRSTAVAAGTIWTDHWATYAGVPVSEHQFPGEPWGADVLDYLESHPTNAEDPAFGTTNIPQRSQYINVVNGCRVSYRVENPDLTIWMFGGSSTYGIGQRDEHTIASEIARAAEQDGRSIRIVNFGVNADVNWQETQRFEHQLELGGHPDMALFLDGINDITLGYEREVYGRLDASIPETLASTKALQQAARADAANRDWVETHVPGRQQHLAAEQYRAGVLRARALGEQYGVSVLHYWQPGLISMPVTAPGIPTALNNVNLDPDYLPKAQRQYKTTMRLSGVDPIDITDIFDDASQPMLFDYVHGNEASARVEAAAMYPHIDRVLDGQAAGDQATAGSAPTSVPAPAATQG